MPTQRKSSPRKSRSAPEEPAQLSWQRQPTRPRSKIRKMQGAAPNATTGRSSAGRRKRAAQPALDLSWGVHGRLAIVGVVLVVLSIGFGLLTSWPALKVAGVSTQIGGNNRVSSQAIYTTSGVDGHTSLFIRPREVAHAVETMPGIAAADVRVRLPNQVIIDVQEENPLVAWQGMTTTVWLSAEGAEVPQEGPLPPLTLTDLTGAALSDSQRDWPAVLADLAALKAAQPAINELSLGTLEGLYFRTADGTQVWLGRYGGITGKLALLKSIQQELAGRGETPAVIDIRFSDKQAFIR